MGIPTRRASLALTAALAVVLSSAGAASAAEDFAFERVSGDTREGTSAQIAAKYGKADSVILAASEDAHTVDALSANFLAGALDAPIVLTHGEGETVSERAREAIDASGARNIYIVGGHLAVSEAQEKELRDAGYEVERIGDGDRYDTNAAIVAEAGDRGSATAFIASDASFADALAAGPVAYAGGIPVGLTNGTSVDEDVIKALKDAGVENAIILGGDQRIKQSVIDQLEAADIDVAEDRLAGNSRSGTAVQIAEWAIAEGILNADGVNLATGRVFGNGADALSGGPLSGQQQRALLISESADQLDRATESNIEDFLKDNAATLQDGYVFGGKLAISDAVVEQAAKAAQGEAPATNQSYTVVGGGETVAQDAEVTYTVTGVDSDKVTISLAEAINVLTAEDGTVSFKTQGGNVRLGTVNAKIVSVNDAVVTPASGSVTIAPKADGTVTFTVKGAATAGAERIVPVVFADTDDKEGLSVDADGLPTEAFGVGPATFFADIADIEATTSERASRFAENRTVTAQLVADRDVDGDGNADPVDYAGEHIVFTVMDQDGAVVTVGRGQTNDSGAATFSYTIEDPTANAADTVTHTVVAAWDENGNGNIDPAEVVDDSVNVVWSDATGVVDVAVDNAFENLSSVVFKGAGGTHTVTATVTDQFGAPISGADVTFTVNRYDEAGGQAEEAAKVTRQTNADGVAALTYTGPRSSAVDVVNVAAEGIDHETAIGWYVAAEAGDHTASLVGSGDGVLYGVIDGGAAADSVVQFAYRAGDVYQVDGNVVSRAAFEARAAELLEAAGGLEDAETLVVTNYLSEDSPTVFNIDLA